MDTVSDNNQMSLLLYQVLCEVLLHSNSEATVNAFEIMLSAQAAMSSVQLPPPSTIKTSVMHSTMM